MSIRTIILKALLLLPLSTSAMAMAKVPSTVALQVSTGSTVFYGEAIDGVAQVTASDGSAVSGTITFFDGAASFCTLTLSDGASCPENTGRGFGAGPHVFTAVYSGDATHKGGTSNAVTVTVAQDTTTTALASSVSEVAAGAGVVYTATVAGAHGAATGSVTFVDGAMPMGSATLDGNGTAALSVLMFAPGDHAITAAYAGNVNSAGSTSAALHEMVRGELAATTTSLTVSANPVAVGASVTFTASVTAEAKAAPAGVVTFVEGGAVLGSAAVNVGSASWSTSGLSAGSHSILAKYAGDALTAASDSAAVSLVVDEPAEDPGLTLGVDQVTVAVGDTVSVPVKMTGGSGLAKAVSLSCSGLPAEASCSYVSGAAANGGGTATLQISTSAPRDCGSSTPYGVAPKSAGMPMAGPVFAGLMLMFVPRRRRVVKGLLALVCMVLVAGAMSGCGTGNCTDLGTRPGTYTITVTGSVGGAVVSQEVKLVVTP